MAGVTQTERQKGFCGAGGGRRMGARPREALEATLNVLVFILKPMKVINVI